MMTSLRQQRLKQIQIIRLTAFLGALFLILFVITFVQNMLLSCLLAFVLSYLLDPAVDAIERMGLRRLQAVVITFAILTSLSVAGLSLLKPFLFDQVSSLETELPKYVTGIRTLIHKFSSEFDWLSGLLSGTQLSSRIESLALTWTHSIFQDLPAFLSKSLTTFFLAPFLTFFLLLDGKGFSRKLLSLVPNQWFELVLNLYHQINIQMGQFVRARLLEAAIVGSVVGVGLWISSFPYAFLLSLFAALTNLIPYVGPLVGAVPAILLALLGPDPLFWLILILVIYLIAQLIDMLFIIPLVVAKIVDLHPVTVVVAILIGAQLLGVLGMLISIPLASAIKVTSTTLYQHLTEFRA